MQNSAHSRGRSSNFGSRAETPKAKKTQSRRSLVGDFCGLKRRGKYVEAPERGIAKKKTRKETCDRKISSYVDHTSLYM